VSAGAVFTACNQLAVVGWLLLVFAPRRGWATLTAGTVLPLLFAAAYLTLLALHHNDVNGGGFSTLAAVATLFSNPWLLLAGWLHYLAFDLFVGAWEVRDASTRGVPHVLVVPCLLLTFLLGPIGLLAYRAVRLIATARTTPTYPSRDPLPHPSDR
jgi:Domain of unknown function (DUF4281)